jgi:hypothetical protein
MALFLTPPELFIPLPESSPKERPPRLVILFGAPTPLTAHIRKIARDLGYGVVEPRHLQAACRALDGAARPFVFASATLKPWERNIVIEHGRRHNAEILWIDGAHDGSRTTARVRERLERWARANGHGSGTWTK